MIYINNDKDIEGMRLACRIAAETLDYMDKHVRFGITTDELNTLAHDFIVSKGAVPAPLNYHGFPKSICTSVNEVVSHGVPSDYVLTGSDSLNIDVTVIKNGYHGDTSRMYTVGVLGIDALRLISHTERCMYAGIGVVRDGAKFSDIAKAIDREHKRLCGEMRYVNKPELVQSTFGHGIGKTFHAEPLIPHYTNNSTLVMREGMCFTIEPCFTCGGISAQYEHTILVTKDGYDILTQSH